MAQEGQQQRPYHMGGGLVINGNRYTFGSGGSGGLPSIPYGSWPITPNEIGPWGQAHGAIGINHNSIYDPMLRRNREGIEIHSAASGNRMCTSQGCVTLPHDQFVAVKSQIRQMMQQNGSAYLNVGPQGITVTPTKSSVQTATQPQQTSQQQSNPQQAQYSPTTSLASNSPSITPTPIPFRPPPTSVSGRYDVPTYDPSTGQYSWPNQGSTPSPNSAVPPMDVPFAVPPQIPNNIPPAPTPPAMPQGQLGNDFAIAPSQPTSVPPPQQWQGGDTVQFQPTDYTQLSPSSVYAQGATVPYGGADASIPSGWLPQSLSDINYGSNFSAPNDQFGAFATDATQGAPNYLAQTGPAYDYGSQFLGSPDYMFGSGSPASSNMIESNWSPFTSAGETPSTPFFNVSEQPSSLAPYGLGFAPGTQAPLNAQLGDQSAIANFGDFGTSQSDPNAQVSAEGQASVGDANAQASAQGSASVGNSFDGAIAEGSATLSPATQDFYAANDQYGEGGWYYDQSGNIRSNNAFEGAVADASATQSPQFTNNPFDNSGAQFQLPSQDSVPTVQGTIVGDNGMYYRFDPTTGSYQSTGVMANSSGGVGGFTGGFGVGGGQGFGVTQGGFSTGYTPFGGGGLGPQFSSTGMGTLPPGTTIQAGIGTGGQTIFTSGSGQPYSTRGVDPTGSSSPGPGGLGSAIKPPAVSESGGGGDNDYDMTDAQYAQVAAQQAKDALPRYATGWSWWKNPFSQGSFAQKAGTSGGFDQGPFGNSTYYQKGAWSPTGYTNDASLAIPMPTSKSGAMPPPQGTGAQLPPIPTEPPHLASGGAIDISQWMMKRKSGKVPGVDHGRDEVNALLEPGEIVVNKRQMAGLHIKNPKLLRPDQRKAIKAAQRKKAA